jgi:hypothetical protein
VAWCFVPDRFIRVTLEDFRDARPEDLAAADREAFPDYRASVQGKGAKHCSMSQRRLPGSHCPPARRIQSARAS